jgi:hypothetical protein
MVMWAGSMIPYTKFVVYFINLAIHIPGCRDIFKPGYALSPDDAKLFAYMDLNPKAVPMIWNTWGLWAICLAWMKMLAIYMASMPFIVLGCISCLGTALIFVKEEGTIKEGSGATILPFIVIFGLDGFALLLSFVM